ncbi:MAG: precorrin-6y C5,15-methyltransferase (decarboxylating) subunit CbiE [Planctomycetales bacterium]|nr:precorrin-6y C5,15-methyltransferase (decarboxylating) subunit CbiE [Planctomycetales bacterium]
MDEKITIIGIGDDGLEGLTRHAHEIISSAGTLLGPANLLQKIEGGSQELIPLSADLEQLAASIEAARARPLVLLASGDPLFYGTARFLCEKLGKDRFEVLPHVSSMQLAFARVKESWDEAYLTNLATQSLPRVVEKIRSAEKVGVFTSDEHPPAKLAEALLAKGIDYFTAYVCENLGSPDERVTRGTLSELAAQTFGSLNVMVLVRLPDVPDRPPSLRGKRLFGNPDEYFLQSRPKRGLLTPSEVRVIALSEMDLGPTSVVWDVGAGSGSVAIESAQLSPAGRVFAIEMDPEDFNLLIENSQTFGTENLTPILGEAPQAWQDLPDPDAIFVGGTGRSVVKLVQSAWARLRQGGRLVVNVSSLDNLTSVEQALRALACDPRVLMINLSRSQQQFESLRLEAANPSFLIIARKTLS